MAGKRVAVLDPNGQFGTVDESELDQLPDGARVLTKQQLAERKLEQEYDQASTLSKVAGLTVGLGAKPPTLDAFQTAGRKALTAGLDQAFIHETADAIQPGAGARYAERLDDLETASPNASTAGTVAGVAAGIAIGATGGAGAGAGVVRGLPVNAISAAGAPLEAAVARSLGGLAARGALGRAATTGASMAVRGAFEGGVYAGLETASDSIVHDDPKLGEKLYAAVGHGALAGGAFGGALGFTGSLAKSGVKGLASRVGRRLEQGATTAEAGAIMAQPPAAPAPRGIELPAIDADAGLRGPAPKGAAPFIMGAERRPMQLRPDVGQRGRVATEEPISFGRRLSIDPDAGLREPASEGLQFIPHQNAGRSHATVMVDAQALDRAWSKDAGFYIGRGEEGIAGRRAGVESFLGTGKPFQASRVSINKDGRAVFTDGRHRFATLRDLGVDRVAVTVPKADLKRLPAEWNVGPLESAGASAERGPVGSLLEARIDPNAGIAKRGARGKFQGKVEADDALKLSSAKNVPRDVGLNVGDEFAPVAAERPIKIPGAPEPPAAGGGGAAKKPSILSMLSDPNNAARAAAQDQAWNAVGAGYGLQTTRYAKEAAKHFPNGTRDLGEVALRHGLVDMGRPDASPLEAAWSAAKSGTAADIAPRAEMALDAVGRKIGEITEASSARVKLADIDRAIGSVRAPYDRIAGNEHVVNAIDNYAASLRSKLGGADDVSIQSLLEQRKGLDQIVYQETKTLDPGRRVAALREVRSELESVITRALDDASGKVPGELRSQYQTLKKDYHALRILQQAAEDSAARASKGATLGLGEKFAVAQAVATGHFAAAPVLAVGGKMLRERGNAAAAAFLSRAADRGTFAEVIRQFDRRVSKAAAGVLREPGDAAPRKLARPAPARRQTESGRAEVEATQKQAQTIVKWVGNMRANPRVLMDQLEEAAALVGQSAGPKAAESYTASTVQAIGFVAAYIPVKERRDPLDPRSVPPLTYDEADKLVRAAKYAAQPATVFDDFERGIVTAEGLRAAKTFMPDAFVEFQMQLQEHVEAHMLRRNELTQSQRLRIDKLLGYPAGADLKPRAIARLQANLMQAPEEPPPADPTGGGAAPPPVNLKVQQTGFDAIEARRAAS